VGAADGGGGSAPYDEAMPGRNRKVEQGDVTRESLVRVAIALFAEKGFAETSTTEIVRLAEVTRGALYHHFTDKEELFRAAFQAIQEGISDRCQTAIAGLGHDAGPVTRLLAGADAFLDACLEVPVQRIVLQEGPLVLGWQRSLRFDDPHCPRRLLIGGVTEAMRAGALAEQPAEPLTHLLFGALMQAGVVIAGSDDQRQARVAMGRAVTSLFESVFDYSGASADDSASRALR
jgi:AcrR family transcriptional regulator